MARARVGRALVPRWRGVVLAGLLLGLTGGCTDDPPGDTPPPGDPGSVALRITTQTGGQGLDGEERSDVESAIGEVLSAYVDEAYLGDYPRDSFVSAFDDFTDGASGLAARDLEVLTAAGVDDVTGVRATRLDADLSLYVVDGTPLGVTARVDFAFDAATTDESTRRLTLAGRLLLSRTRDGWAVFGYDVTSDDGAAVGGAS